MNNTEQIIEKLNDLRKEILNKKGRLFFLVADTFGTPMASVEYIYRLAKQMQEDSYQVCMIYDDTKKFIGVRGWMGDKYADLPHMSVKQMSENKSIQIRASDYFFVPEIYADFYKKLYESKLPSETVLICQSHTFIFKYLNVGEKWKFFGIENVITTSGKMKRFLEEYQPVNNIHVVNPPITKEFSPSTAPQQPIISIISRNTDEIERLMKLFYQKYPMYGWISFKTLGGMTKEDFANSLKESCLSIWLDDFATFGTFPLESMACGVPVIVKIPDLIPEWAEKQNEENGTYTMNDNAIFVSNVLAIPDFIAKFMESWLLDDITPVLYENMKNSPKQYSEANFTEQTLKTFRKILELKVQKIEATKAKYIAQLESEQSQEVTEQLQQTSNNE